MSLKYKIEKVKVCDLNYYNMQMCESSIIVSFSFSSSRAVKKNLSSSNEKYKYLKEDHYLELFKQNY